MANPPVIEYAAGEPPRGKWHVPRAVLAVLTVVVCFYLWFGAMDARTFARKWKEYGQNPALQPQIDAAARAWTVRAVVVWSVAAVGWASYFVVRGRSGRVGKRA